MSGRNLDGATVAQLGASVISPAILAQLTFKTSTQFVWNGVGPLLWNGNTFVGGGGFVSMGSIVEGTSVEAAGTTVSLSGIPSTLVTECLTDIQQGAAAKIWMSFWANGGLITTPYLAFSGTVDKPSLKLGSKTSTIALALENKLVNLQRASNRRYTAADQHLVYPDDTGFSWVEILNDIALKWGES